jgi:hypothetical protein
LPEPSTTTLSPLTSFFAFLTFFLFVASATALPMFASLSSLPEMAVVTDASESERLTRSSSA